MSMLLHKPYLFMIGRSLRGCLSRATHFTAVRYRLAFAAGLRTLVVFAATSLSEDTVLLYFAVEPLECDLK
jgi:hypothetical protein